MKSYGCNKGTSLVDNKRDIVFLALKSTSQSRAQLDIISRSGFRRRAAVWGFSTMIYKLVSSAKRRIGALISLTMSLIKIRKRSGPSKLLSLCLFWLLPLHLKSLLLYLSTLLYIVSRLIWTIFYLGYGIKLGTKLMQKLEVGKVYVWIVSWHIARYIYREWLLLKHFCGLALTGMWVKLHLQYKHDILIIFNPYYICSSDNNNGINTIPELSIY